MGMDGFLEEADSRLRTKGWNSFIGQSFQVKRCDEQRPQWRLERACW